MDIGGMFHIGARLQRNRLVWGKLVAFSRVPGPFDYNDVSVFWMKVIQAHCSWRKLHAYHVKTWLGGVSVHRCALHTTAIGVASPFNLFWSCSDNWELPPSIDRNDGARSEKETCHNVLRQVPPISPPLYLETQIGATVP